MRRVVFAGPNAVGCVGSPSFRQLFLCTWDHGKHSRAGRGTPRPLLSPPSPVSRGMTFFCLLAFSCFFFSVALFFKHSNSKGASAFQRDLSLKLEAQFLRTLACRAGVLGGVSARLGDAPSSSPGATASGVAGMDVDDNGDDNDNGRVPADEKGDRDTVIPGGMGGAVPGHLMRRLQTLSLRMVEKYAMLSQKDKALACRALCQLWLAFSGPGQGDNLCRMVRGDEGGNPGRV